MPRIRSIVARVEVDRAKKAHNCQANAKHRIERGDLRLNVRMGRGWDRYCIRCAQVIVGGGITRLESLALELRELPDSVGSRAGSGGSSRGDRAG